MKNWVVWSHVWCSLVLSCMLVIIMGYLYWTYYLLHVVIVIWKIMYLILWQAFSENFTGLELEDGGGRGTSGHWLQFYLSRAHPFVSSLHISCVSCWIQAVSTLQETFFMCLCQCGALWMWLWYQHNLPFRPWTRPLRKSKLFFNHPIWICPLSFA